MEYLILLVILFGFLMILCHRLKTLFTSFLNAKSPLGELNGRGQRGAAVKKVSFSLK